MGLCSLQASTLPDLMWDPCYVGHTISYNKHLDSLFKPFQGPPSVIPHSPITNLLKCQFLFSNGSSHPPTLPPLAWKDGKLTLTIPQQMVTNSKESFTFSAIGRFVGRRPSLERLEQWVHSSWRCLGHASPV